MSDTNPESSGLPMFYSAPRPLDREKDAVKRVRHKGFGFARNTNAIPLLLDEFPMAAAYYPIVVAAGPTPVTAAVVGLETDSNLFVNKDGDWVDGCYLPSYVRRYPFILMDDPDHKQFVLCIDAATDFLNEQEGEVLFEEGKPSALNILTNGLLNPDYQRDISSTLTAAYLPSDVYAGTLVTTLGMIDGGTTTVVDTSQVQHSPEHTDASIKAHQDAGLRVVYAYSRGTGPQAQYPQDIARLRRTYFNTTDQLLTLALGSTLEVSLFRAAREAGVPTVSHGVSNTTARMLMELDQAGLLRAGDEYIHCTHLPAEGWKLIKDSGGHVSIAVPIEMAMGHGLPPIQDAIDHGVRPSLSSDVDVTMAQDPFTNMRAAFTLQRLGVLQRARNNEPNLPPLLTCREVLEFATINGAICTGLDRKIGTLTPGKEADIVMLAADRLNVWPLNNVPGCVVVNLMNPANVDAVFIAGKVKKWRGNLVGVDHARMLRLAREARDGVIRRANFQTNLFG